MDKQEKPMSKTNEVNVLITEKPETAKVNDRNAIDTKGYDAVIEVGKGQSEESIDKDVWKQMEKAFGDHISVEHFGCAVNGLDEDCSHYVSDAPLKLTLDECTKETTTAALFASQFCACNGVQMRTEFLERDRDLVKSEEQKSQESSRGHDLQTPARNITSSPATLEEGPEWKKGKEALSAEKVFGINTDYAYDENVETIWKRDTGHTKMYDAVMGVKNMFQEQPGLDPADVAISRDLDETGAKTARAVLDEVKQGLADGRTKDEIVNNVQNVTQKIAKEATIEKQPQKQTPPRKNPGRDDDLCL